MKNHHTQQSIHHTLSVVLAVQNEDLNLAGCLDSIKSIASEIIVVDDGSTDKTVSIAGRYTDKIFTYIHKNNFHETKQYAIEKAKCDWILQLDADERVTKELAEEINEVINASNNDLLNRVIRNPMKMNEVESSIIHQPLNSVRLYKLFSKHQHLIEQREGYLGKPTGEVVAFFIPRVNYFLGKPLIHAGVFPDGVIRLFKNGKARLPAKSVHELMEVNGELGWLFSSLEHHESPNVERYIKRMNRYTDYQASMMKKRKVGTNYWNLLKYSFLVPVINFLKLYVRHKGFLDGMRGFIWCAFSSLHFSIAYFKYWQINKA